MFRLLVAAADIETLRRAGLDDRAILDARNVVAYFNYANRMTLGLGVRPATEPTRTRRPPMPSPPGLPTD
jgi:hypothetical protein